MSWTGSGGLLGPTWALEGLMTTLGDPFLLMFGLLLVYVLIFFLLCVRFLSLRMLAFCLLSSSRQKIVECSKICQRDCVLAFARLVNSFLFVVLCVRLAGSHFFLS